MGIMGRFVPGSDCRRSKRWGKRGEVSAEFRELEALKSILQGTYPQNRALFHRAVRVIHNLDPYKRSKLLLETTSGSLIEPG